MLVPSPDTATVIRPYNSVFAQSAPILKEEGRQAHYGEMAPLFRLATTALSVSRSICCSDSRLL